MRAHPTPAPTDAAPSAPEPNTPSHPHRAILEELLEIGMRLARNLDTPAADPTAATNQAAAFDRIARAIRRTILLARHLDQASAPAPRPEAARRQIIRAVEDAIHTSHVSPNLKDGLQAELVERLERPELADDIAARPVPEIIAEICRDLGLESLPGVNPHKRRRPADIAALCARAARPAAPANQSPPHPAPSTPAPIDPAANAAQPEPLLYLLTPKPARPDKARPPDG